jgi:hypothetical protein
MRFCLAVVENQNTIVRVSLNDFQLSAWKKLPESSPECGASLHCIKNGGKSTNTLKLASAEALGHCTDLLQKSLNITAGDQRCISQT